MGGVRIYDLGILFCSQSMRLVSEHGEVRFRLIVCSDFFARYGPQAIIFTLGILKCARFVMCT